MTDLLDERYEIDVNDRPVGSITTLSPSDLPVKEGTNSLLGIIGNQKLFSTVYLQAQIAEE